MSIRSRTASPGQMDLFAEAGAARPPFDKGVPVQQPVKARTVRMAAAASKRKPSPASKAKLHANVRPLPRARSSTAGHLLDVPGAADYLGLSASTLNKMRCAGHGPAFLKITRAAVRYDPKDLDSWIAARRSKSTSDS